MESWSAASEFDALIRIMVIQPSATVLSSNFDRLNAISHLPEKSPTVAKRSVRAVTNSRSGVITFYNSGAGGREDGFLRMYEIYKMKLQAEMVVLSGCRIGLGKEIKGEGLIGLTRGFLSAGAARVVVSLWDVDDQGTAELMARFYKCLLGNLRNAPAAALRAAQISMLRDKRWHAPYYWAAFLLEGEPN